MYIMPVWYLPFLTYAMWMGMFWRPLMESAENVVESAENVVATQETESTPV